MPDLEMKKKYDLRSFFGLFLLVSIKFDLLAQSTDSIKQKALWVEQFRDRMALETSVNNAYETFEVKTSSGKYLIYPNVRKNCRFDFNYRFLSFGIQFTPTFLPGNDDNRIKGNTKSIKVTGSFILPHWLGSYSYTKMEGYYLKNSEDFILRSKEDPYILFPSLQYTRFTGNIGYIRNPSFSYRSISSLTERQLKSAGSFISILTVRYYTIDDKNNKTGTQKSNTAEASICPGYYYTFVVKSKFFITSGILTGVGYLNSRIITRDVAGNIYTTQNNLLWRWEFNGGMGYNSKQFYTGISTNISGIKYRQQYTTATNQQVRNFLHIYLGFRFKSPSYFNNMITKLENKFPLLR